MIYRLKITSTGRKAIQHFTTCLLFITVFHLPLAAQINPAKEYEQLFHAVQMARVFEDSKTFADCIPQDETEDIQKRYERRKGRRTFNLKGFADRYFALPANPASGFESNTELSVEEHINRLWPILTREPDIEKGSLIPLPYPYIVPGGRFREIYYWDSYFTMLGLQESGEIDLIKNMADNFTYLVQTYGFIPNGNRAYYLSRSQPPFYAMVLQLLAEEKGEETLADYLPHLEREYSFWMDGADRLPNSETAYRRVVKLKDGEILNRYWDDSPEPRPESYYEDVELSEHSGQAPEQLYRNLRAACESGWDFSSRWLREPADLGTIHTSEIIPVDLNCLVYNMERTLARAHAAGGNQQKAMQYRNRAQQRKVAIRKYCWNVDKGFFFDYDFAAGQQKGVYSMAAAYPLFFGLATLDEAEEVAGVLEEKFLKEGGLLTTLETTGQQWDSPNGWAPLQWVAFDGLRQYGQHELAGKVADRWIALNRKVYKNTGKLVEKYDVTGTTDKAGGGEYPLQDGFGWTNGVLLKMIKETE